MKKNIGLILKIIGIILTLYGGFKFSNTYFSGFLTFAKLINPIIFFVGLILIIISDYLIKSARFICILGAIFLLYGGIFFKINYSAGESWELLYFHQYVAISGIVLLILSAILIYMFFSCNHPFDTFPLNLSQIMSLLK